MIKEISVTKESCLTSLFKFVDLREITFKVSVIYNYEIFVPFFV